MMTERDLLALLWFIGLIAMALYGQEKGRPFVGVWFVMTWYLVVPVLLIAGLEIAD